MAERLLSAALGCSSHSGWAAVVCLAASDSSLYVVERTRWLLTTAPLPREPYHEAKRGAPENAEKTVAAAADEARALAIEAIVGLSASVAAQGYELIAAGVVLGGGRPGGTLSQALSTHAAMHGAEGWLFREALMKASQKCGLKSVGVSERELLSGAASALETSERGVSELVHQIGRRYGPPWRRDQKAAASAAIVAVHSSLERASRP